MPTLGTGGRDIVHVVVVGCGRVGSGLAQAVEAAGHTAAIIDKRDKAFARLPDTFQGKCIVGVGFDRDRLADAGIDRAEAVAAVTSGDNSNIMIARVAKETYGIERVVARIYDPRRAAIYERLGIPTIATVQWATERVLRRILPDQGTVEWIDPSTRICLIERMLPTSWAGRKLGELEIDGLARVAGVSRLGVGQVPTGDLVIQEGDVVYAAVVGDKVIEFEQHLNGGGQDGGRH